MFGSAPLSGIFLGGISDFCTLFFSSFMRNISSDTILKTAKELIETASFHLPAEIKKKISECAEKETAIGAKSALKAIAENFVLAPKEKLPLCQDTGTAVFFVEIGHKVQLDEPIFETLEKAVQQAYSENYLRPSIVEDPLFFRKNTGNNCPPVVHIEQRKGDKIRLSFLAKGGGAENKSTIKMLRPADGKEGVMRTVINAAKSAGGSSCPPWIIGIGIGGSFDSVAILAKKALLRPFPSSHSKKEYAELEQEITEKIEGLKIGAMGFGGEKTVLGVHIESAPTHIASLPIAINFQCHSARSATIII